MFLKRLELVNFKSFAHKNVLDFPAGHTCTAIVGPNGSGKSNVADAIRWVLGEQGYKSLRTKKSEDLIFAGSSKKGRASFCEVSLFLDNQDGKADIDFSEVVIARRIYRDGENEYFINKSKVRLFDVVQLLASAKFGQSTYSVIGQGMVGELLSYGKEEKKVFFDEACGVRKLKIQKEETFKKINASLNNITRVEDILREITPQLNFLKRQVRRASEKEEIEQRLDELYGQYFGNKWHYISSALNELQKSYNENNQEAQKIQKEKEEIDRELKIKKDPGDHFDLIEKEKEKLENLVAEKDKIKEKLILSMGRLEALKYQKGFSEGDRISDLKKKISNISGTLSFLLKEKEKQTTLIEKVESKKSAISDKDLISLTDQALKEYQNLLLDIKNKNLAEVEKKSQTVLENFKAIKKEIESRFENKDAKTLQLKESFQKIQIDIARISAQKEIFEKDLLESNENIKKEEPAGVQWSGEELKNNIQKSKQEVAEAEQKVEAQKANLAQKERETRQKESLFFEKRDKLYEKSNLLSQFENELSNIKIEMAREETKKEGLFDEIKKEKGPLFLNDLAQGKVHFSVVPSENIESLAREMEKLKDQSALCGSIDPETVSEYEAVSNRCNFLKEQVDDLYQTKKELEEAAGELDKKLQIQFNENIGKISEKFNHYFTILFDGGRADLVVDQKEEGNITVDFEIPGKRLKNLAALSGGEKTLLSLALLFAIFAVNPAPFCILDEVDAALDEQNTLRFLKILNELSQKTQFITITHNKETMKAAQALYGVTMSGDHTSKVISIILEEAEKVGE